MAGRLSYWDREYRTTYNYIIVGAGLSGLSAAIFTKRLAPKATILVLEQGAMPMGATTRNAGFLCYGSLTEFLYNCDRNISDAIQQVKDRRDGAQHLLNLVNPRAIDYRQHGNYEIIDNEHLYALGQISVGNIMLQEVFKTNDDIFSIVKRDFGFSDAVKAVVYNKFEGQINSGKLYTELMNLALKEGIEFKFGAKVFSVDNGVHTQDVSFKCDKVAICTNGYTRDLLPEYDIIPGRGQVVISKPFDWNIEVPFHYNKGYYYFRYIDGRLLVGGGRNTDFVGERTTYLGNNEKILGSIRNFIDNVLGFNELEIDYSWSGIMGFSADKKSIAEYVPGRKNVIIGFGCNGMGVALGAGIGKQVSELLTT